MCILLNSMESETDQTKFSALPDIIKGCIASQLVNIIGTKEIINEADFPVIVKNIQRLSMVDKSFYQAINSEIATYLVMQAFVKRFKLNDLDAAAILNTRGSREWLKKHDQYALFKIVQKIINIVREIRKEAKDQNIAYLIDKENYCPAPGPYYGQTEKGLFLCVDVDPYSLYTPWGNIELLYGGSGSLLGRILLTQSLLKRLKTSLAYSCESSAASYYQVIQQIKIEDVEQDANNGFSDSKYFKMLSKEEIKRMLNQEDIIVSSKSRCGAIYEILQVDQASLPEPKMLPWAKHRESKKINTLWKSLFDIYCKEQKIKPIEGKNSALSNKHNFSQTQPRGSNLTIKTIDDIIFYCISLLKQVIAQPVSDKKIPPDRKIKFLRYINCDDCRICEILSRRAAELLNEKWAIYARDWEYPYEGLELAFYDVEPEIKVLCQTFQNIISQLKSGWKAANLKDYTNISHKESEEEWYLFIKNNTFDEEDILISLLASKLGLSEIIDCQDDWSDPSGANVWTNNIYLWIKKDSINKFRDAFNFDLVS